MSRRVPGRRSFIDWLLGTSLGGLLLSVTYPVLRYVSPPEVPEATTSRVEAGPTNDPELLEKGFKIIRFGAEPVIVIRLGADQFRAFAATCTHLDCIVSYRPELSRIFCYCHNGQFDLGGANVGGPPPRPLTAYQVDLTPGDSGRPPVIVVSQASA